MIIETIISTINTKGDVNFAPFGIKKRKNFVFISPYIPSKTLENLKKSGTAVINYIDDAKYFVDCLTGNKRFKKLESVKFKGFFLADSLYHEEVKVVSVKNHKIRPTFKCEIVGEFIHKKYSGHNRARSAILEACILASRLNMIREENIRDELNYLEIIIDKTAGKRERSSWFKIKKFIEKYFDESKKKKQNFWLVSELLRKYQRIYLCI